MSPGRKGGDSIRGRAPEEHRGSPIDMDDPSPSVRIRAIQLWNAAFDDSSSAGTGAFERQPESSSLSVSRSTMVWQWAQATRCKPRASASIGVAAPESSSCSRSRDGQPGGEFMV